jgi:HAD domain in Swiss Army Knife RNA repair proteins
MRVGPFGWLPHLARELVGHVDVELVVHSSWREVYTLEELQEMLLELGARQVDVAPPGGRYVAIESWLKAQGESIDYLVVDDEPGEFPVPKPEWLLVCNPTEGISEAVVVHRLRAWLMS